jgi:hypothetical protein
MLHHSLVLLASTNLFYIHRLRIKDSVCLSKDGVAKAEKVIDAQQA